MSEANALANFDGRVRLFPLPNLVLFPHVVQPLHIFEPRYRQLMADALAADRLITLALLCSGHESDYEGRPPIHPVVCVGEIVQEECLPDGRYNLLLRGLSRARILEEMPPLEPYRVADVKLLADIACADQDQAQRLRERLGSRLSETLAGNQAVLKQLRTLLDSELPLGVLGDIVSFALPLPVEFKQSLLAEPRVDKRMETLLGGLEPPSVRRKYPPEFSAN
jgi:Lon protease-like protein